MVDNAGYRPEFIADIAVSIQTNLQNSIDEIKDVHERTHVLSINARIEAARSGKKGLGFKIVAEEFSRLNNEIARISETLGENLQSDSDRLMDISGGMARQVRGQRLSQIALSVMDVIDRNLYERTCDVRWWATDASVVEALSETGGDALVHAGKRLGVILDAYTVYLDIVLADRAGRIVANGRPDQFSSRGSYCGEESWFHEALASADGDSYTFKGTHASPLVDNHKILVYGCPVIKNDTGLSLGTLGIFFNWDGLVTAVLDRVINIDLFDDIKVMKLNTSVSIVDGDGTVLASSDKNLEDQQNFFPSDIIESRETGYKVRTVKEGIQLLAYGYSPGFETYSTGWYCIISQIVQL